MHVWGGCCVRLTEAQLTEPREDRLPTWPISYAELEPYYTEAEKALKVQLTNLSGLERRVEQAVAREFPEAHVIPRPVAKLKFPELREELGALESLTLIPNAVVYQLALSQKEAKIDRIRYIDCCSGKSAEVSSSVVMLCASTLESTRVLLQSATDVYPDGLGNSSGVLGKFLMDHTYGGLSELAPLGDREQASFRDRVGRRVRGFVFGPKSPRFDPSEGIYIHRDVSPGARQYGFEAGFPDAGHFWIAAFGEVDPSACNRAYLDSVRRDCWGLPVPSIELRYSERDRKRMSDALEFCVSLLEILDLASDYRRHAIATPGESVHEVGTARMGAAPNSSFLNKFNQSWEVSNLFVTDGSAFPASAYQNPTLTMVALTLRACDITASELRRRLSLQPLA